ncbi:MAG: c-type cytochrome [Gammaproteobacteria bacterium]
MKMLVSSTFICLIAVSPAQAGPSSTVAWTPALLDFVKKGDGGRGKELSSSCAGCHGEQGVSPMPNIPSLAGQLATYTYKQLQDYKTGSRAHDMMTPIAAGLSGQEMADLAVWFAGLPAPKNQPGKETLKIAEQLVSKGDGKRVVPSCFVCHGKNGEGEKMDIPALAGQRADYFAETLNAYKSGARHNDIYSRMRLISQQLSEDEIRELAQYYQQLSR